MSFQTASTAPQNSTLPGDRDGSPIFLNLSAYQEGETETSFTEDTSPPMLIFDFSFGCVSKIILLNHLLGGR